MTNGRLLGIGGAHVDRRGRTTKPHVPAVSNPGIMREEIGGGVFNALRSAVQRGTSAALLSVRGGDAAGDAVAAAIALTGIEDISAVYLDRTTPSYTALLDSDGNLLTGLADMSLYDTAFPRQVRRRKTRDAIAAADRIVVDANVPEDALSHLFELGGTKSLYGIAVSPAKVVRLQQHLRSLTCLFMNENEAGALCGKPADKDAQLVRQLSGAGLACAAISRGAAPLLFFQDDVAGAIAPPEGVPIADVTGAGDALAGTTIAGLMLGKPLREALREGMAAATLAIQTMSAVPDLSSPAFEETLRSIPQAMPLD
jgi:sugar/nucleoside kinase (ribokinase family)